MASSDELVGRMLVSSEEDAVRRVVAAFERSDWSEIEVRFGALRVHLSTDAHRATSGPVARTDPIGSNPERSGSADAETTASLPPASNAPIDVPTGAHVVVSPSPGIFWRAPEPGAPPFIDAGQRVDASSTVCIVEIMKLMNHVKAGVAGEVVVVFVENGHAVEKGDPLVAVIPEAGGAGT